MIHTQPLDGYTYLGLFRVLFTPAVGCRGCWDDATSVLTIIGCGDIHTLPVCGRCGPPLDEKLKTHGLRKPIPRPRRITPERRRQIAEAQGSMRAVARLFGIDPGTVKECRHERSFPT